MMVMMQMSLIPSSIKREKKKKLHDKTLMKKKASVRNLKALPALPLSL